MTSREGFAPLLGAASLAAVAAWTTALSWRVLTEDFAEVAVPLLFLGAVVAVLGAVGRWLGLPAYAVVLAQSVVVVLLVLMGQTGSALPTPASVDTFVTMLQQAAESARTYAAPVPVTSPPIHPLLVVAGAALLVLGDACVGIGRAPAMGLPLLAAYTLPLSVTDHGVSWWVFAGAAVAYVALVHVEHSERIGGWGRSARTPSGRQESLSVRTGSIGTTAFSIGAAAIGLGLVVPLGIPTLDVSVFSGGEGAGSGPLEVANPVVDMRRDLNRGVDVPLLRVDTTGPRPSYLRLSALTRFADGRWTPGDREIPEDQTATGDLPAPQGVILSAARAEADYRIRVFDDLKSAWLPTAEHVTTIDAGPDWRYDVATRDFMSVDPDVTTAGVDYTFTATTFAPGAEQMDQAPSGSSAVPPIFTEVPPTINNEIRRLAAIVTAEAPTRFQKAQALQQWFRHDGGFRYDVAQAASLGSGVADLEAFLDESGRVGYCEQFAGAMAIMARTLGIPARVAVGFLQPERAPGGSWIYSAWDMHAWPELFFPGSGWVRFEPTPSARTGQAPAYTTQEMQVAAPLPSPSASRSSELLPDRTETPATDPDARTGSTGLLPWREVLVAVALVGLVVLLLLLPRWIRRVQRSRRLARGVEGAWAELQAVIVDLGHQWPWGRSPRRTGRVLGTLLAHPGPGQADRPRRGRDQDPEAAAALDRLVVGLERNRYARASPEPDHAQLAADLDRVTASLTAGVAPGARRRAAWWPRSVLSRRSGPRPPSQDMANGESRRSGAGRAEQLVG